MSAQDLDDTPSPMDPMLVKAIETAFLAFSLPTVEFMPVPQAWREANPSGGSKGPGGPTKARIKLELIERDGFRCAYCAREFVDLNDATLDHVIPNCVVGHWKTWNLVLACQPCNNAKSDAVPLVLMPFLCHLLRSIAPAAIHAKRELRRKRVLTPPQPCNGFPSKKAWYRAQKAAAAHAWRTDQFNKAMEGMTGRPVRLALEAPTARLALCPAPGGQS